MIGWTPEQHLAQGQQLIRRATDATNDSAREADTQLATAHFAAAQAAKAVQSSTPAAPSADMDDDELFASPLGLRLRRILSERLAAYGRETYNRSTRSATASAILAGINEARKCVLPEAVQDGFRDAGWWDEPYTPTDEDRAELLRRIEERGGVRDHSVAEQIAMDIANEHDGMTDRSGAKK